jgi:hypothetical protein
MTEQNKQPQPEPQQPQQPQQPVQHMIKLEQPEFDVAVKLSRDKDTALKEIGLRFLATMEASRHYGNLLSGEQQYLQSLIAKYDLPPQSYLSFGMDGTVTATIPPMAPPMPPIEQPSSETAPPAEEMSGKPTG